MKQFFASHNFKARGDVKLKLHVFFPGKVAQIAFGKYPLRISAWIVTILSKVIFFFFSLSRNARIVPQATSFPIHWHYSIYVVETS
jgi:hypothetical protein